MGRRKGATLTYIDKKKATDKRRLQEEKAQANFEDMLRYKKISKAALSLIEAHDAGKPLDLPLHKLRGVMEAQGGFVDGPGSKVFRASANRTKKGTASSKVSDGGLGPNWKNPKKLSAWELYNERQRKVRERELKRMDGHQPFGDWNDWELV